MSVGVPVSCSCLCKVQAEYGALTCYSTPRRASPLKCVYVENFQLA